MKYFDEAATNVSFLRAEPKMTLKFIQRYLALSNVPFWIANITYSRTE